MIDIVKERGTALGVGGISVDCHCKETVGDALAPVLRQAFERVEHLSSSLTDVGQRLRRARRKIRRLESDRDELTSDLARANESRQSSGARVSDFEIGVEAAVETLKPLFKSTAELSVGALHTVDAAFKVLNELLRAKVVMTVGGVATEVPSRHVRPASSPASGSASS